MTLQELIAYLEDTSADSVATPGFGAPDSYRGYYDQLAFEPSPSSTAGEMLVHARNALGKTFEGYKGGRYTMRERTTVNIAEWGCCGDDDEITPTKLDKMFDKSKKREWVGLTDQDRQEVFESMPDMLEGFLKKWGWLHFSKALEAKLKHKNGYAEESNT